MAHLIGIGYRRGAGKDTIAKIIQCLTAGYSHNQILIAFEQDLFPEHPLYANKKFADKLKYMVCLLIGCTREKLEDPEFKESPLGEKWKRYEIVEHWINDNFSTTKTYSVFNTIEEANDYWNKLGLSDNVADGVFEEILTPRQLLQQLGTEAGRQVHPSVWVNALFVDYTSKNHNKWVISDVRFLDEAQAIKDRGGILIKVNRDTDNDQHESEKALDGYTGWDYVIDNNGSIEGLVDQVETMLNKFKVI